jgi:hypothetical protein
MMLIVKKVGINISKNKVCTSYKEYDDKGQNLLYPFAFSIPIWTFKKILLKFDPQIYKEDGLINLKLSPSDTAIPPACERYSSS